MSTRAMADPVLWEQVDIDLPLAAERVCSVLPGTVPEIAQTTGIPALRVFACLRWLEGNGRVRYRKSADDGPGVWEVR